MSYIQQKKWKRELAEGFHLHPGSSMPVTLSFSSRVSPELWVNGPAKSVPVFPPLLTRHWLWNFQRIRTHNDNSHRDVSMTDWDRTTKKSGQAITKIWFMKYDSRNMLDLFQSVIFIRGECRADMRLWRVRPSRTLVCDDNQSTKWMIWTV